MDKTMTQHTPGPWRFYTEPQPNGCPIVGARGLMVCMLAHTVKQPEQRDEALANAALISAAPDLLAFAKWFLANRDGPGVSMAKAAVDRAVGAA